MIGINGFAFLDELPADIALRMFIREQFDIVAQAPLIALQTDHIISLLIDDLPANPALTSHRVNGHDSALECQERQQPGDRCDLIRLVVDLALPRDKLLIAGQAEITWAEIIWPKSYEWGLGGIGIE